jgi:hypothetical protein
MDHCHFVRHVAARRRRTGSVGTKAPEDSDTLTRIMKAFVEGLKFYREHKEFAIKVTADFARSNDTEVLDKTFDVVTKFQDRVPYVNPKGVDSILKVVELRDPRAKNFTSQMVIDSSILKELEKSGFVEAVWKK